MHRLVHRENGCLKYRFDSGMVQETFNLVDGRTKCQVVRRALTKRHKIKSVNLCLPEQLNRLGLAYALECRFGIRFIMFVLLKSMQIYEAVSL